MESLGRRKINVEKEPRDSRSECLLVSVPCIFWLVCTVSVHFVAIFCSFSKLEGNRSQKLPHMSIVNSSWLHYQQKHTSN